MRITNNMIMSNTKTNINGNKNLVDKYNTQMSTQKKISKASEDPIVAIRSLRLSTSLTHIDQYVDNNIPDSSAWLDVTYTALNNMKTLVSDIRTQCVKGSTDTLTASDRETILKSLEQLSDQVYAEGNSDYAGRTVFTGYRTTENLTFDTDEADTTYSIDQEFSYNDLAEHRYYSGATTVPATVDQTNPCTTDTALSTYDRIRLAYDEVSTASDLSYTSKDGSVSGSFAVTTYESEKEWEQASGGVKTVGDDQVVFLKETGEYVLGKNVAETLRSNMATISVSYEKTGFEEGELRPEYYYNCVDQSDPDSTKWVSYSADDQDINYTIAAGTELTVNTQAKNAFDMNIMRDVNEMMNVVQAATDAETKVSTLEDMMKQDQYADEDSQSYLQTYLDAAKKERDYANDNLQKTYEEYITNFDNYLTKINTAITNVGSTQNRLSMTQTRVENQQTTIEELKSNNEDRDISDIIIDYYAAYNAYQASLTAASKVGSQTLLNYL